MTEQARLKARQGVAYLVQDDADRRRPRDARAVPADGETMGEVVMRGNIVMKGYLKDPTPRRPKAFAGGWFHTGDLGVTHPDGYIELRDRAKDIIISGGENISSIEVENALAAHPAVALAAVVAAPGREVGRNPLRLRRAEAGRDGDRGRTDRLVPRPPRPLQGPATVVFGELPKTSTGKIQKAPLRTLAAGL